MFDEQMLSKRVEMRTIKNLFRYIMLRVCTAILGEGMNTEEEKLVARCYKKLLEDDRKIEEER